LLVAATSEMESVACAEEAKFNNFWWNLLLLLRHQMLPLAAVTWGLFAAVATGGVSYHLDDAVGVRMLQIAVGS
jgi:hypothetical protein